MPRGRELGSGLAAAETYTLGGSRKAGAGPRGLTTTFQIDAPEATSPGDAAVLAVSSPAARPGQASRSSVQQTSLGSKPELHGKTRAWTRGGPKGAPDGGVTRARERGREIKAAEQQGLKFARTSRKSHQPSGKASWRRWHLSRF